MAKKPKRKAVAKARRLAAKELDRQRVAEAASFDVMNELGPSFGAAATARKRGR